MVWRKNLGRENDLRLRLGFMQQFFWGPSSQTLASLGWAVAELFAKNPGKAAFLAVVELKSDLGVIQARIPHHGEGLVDANEAHELSERSAESLATDRLKPARRYTQSQGQVLDARLVRKKVDDLRNQFRGVRRRAGVGATVGLQQSPQAAPAEHPEDELPDLPNLHVAEQEVGHSSLCREVYEPGIERLAARQDRQRSGKRV